MPPTIPQLGATTVNRKWVVDVNTGTSTAPVWVTVGGVQNCTPVSDTANTEDDSDFAGGGYGSTTKTSATWSVALVVKRAVDQATGLLYDIGQEFLRSKAIGKFGPDNTAQIRYYEFTPSGGPRVEAYTGFVGVEYVDQGGAFNALSTVNITLSGQGALTAIAHPYPSTATVPVVTSATPTALAAAGGTLVVISGSGFTAATAVSFAGTNATSFTKINDNTIVAEAPAHAAGSGALVVTNATGPSTTGPTVTFS